MRRATRLKRRKKLKDQEYTNQLEIRRGGTRKGFVRASAEANERKKKGFEFSCPLRKASEMDGEPGEKKISQLSTSAIDRRAGGRGGTGQVVG